MRSGVGEKKTKQKIEIIIRKEKKTIGLVPHSQGTGRASSKEKPDVTESERGSFDPNTNVYPSIQAESLKERRTVKGVDR
jgi:hypothetical protein